MIPPLDITLDVSYFPIEIAFIILSYLSPSDLLKCSLYLWKSFVPEMTSKANLPSYYVQDDDFHLQNLHLQLMRIFSLQEEATKRKSSIIDDTLRRVRKISLQYREMQQQLENLQKFMEYVYSVTCFLLMPTLIYTLNHLFYVNYWICIVIDTIYQNILLISQHFQSMRPFFQYLDSMMYYTICWGVCYSLQIIFWFKYAEMVVKIIRNLVEKGYATKLEARRIKMTLLSSKRDEIHARCKILVDHIHEKLTKLSDREYKIRKSISSYLASRSIHINVFSSGKKPCLVM